MSFGYVWRVILGIALFTTCLIVSFILNSVHVNFMLSIGTVMTDSARLQSIFIAADNFEKFSLPCDLIL